MFAIILLFLLALLQFAPCVYAAVPSPWSPLEVKERAVKVWGRDYLIAANGLPERITSQGTELLGQPVSFQIGDCSQSDDCSLAFNSVSEESAQWESKGTLAGMEYTCRGLAEFDGMMRFDVELNPKTAATIPGLLLKISMPKSESSLLHFFAPLYDYPQMTWFKPERPNSIARPAHWQCQFTPFVWMGNEERGLQWFCESDEGWRPENPKRALEIVQSGDVVTLIAHLSDSPVDLKRFRFTFGLMAGPVKPRTSVFKQGDVRYSHWASYDMAEKMREGSNPPISQLDYLKSLGVQFVGMHEDWTDFQGMPRVTQPEKMRHLVDEVHKREMGLVLYHYMAVPSNAPEFASMAEECICEPTTAFYIHSREPKQSDYPACYRSRWSQLMTDGIGDLFSQYKIDGLYLDGAAIPFWCTNARHGCGYVNDKGEKRPTYTIFATRDQMKRLRRLCDAQNKPTLIVAHMSSFITLPTLSFADVLLTGEQYWKSPETFRPPMEFFRVECMGHPHGIPTHFIGYPPLGGEYARTMTALHNAPSSWCPGGTDLWKLYEEFDVDHAEWFPYWASNNLAQSDNKDVLVSGFRHGGEKTLIVAGSISQASASAKIRLNPDLIDLSKPGLSASDAFTKRPLEITNGELTIQLPPESSQWILLSR